MTKKRERKRRFSGRMKKIQAIVLAAVVILSTIVGSLVWSQSDTALAAETEADVSTTGNWSNTMRGDTQNVGRIWTDKTVSDEDITLTGESNTTIEKGDSDFLIGLSAISSSMEVKGQVAQMVPLDIVVVMDRSISMGQDIDTETNYSKLAVNDYATLYNNSNNAYVQFDGEYYKLTVTRSGQNNNRKYTVSYTKDGKKVNLVNNEANANVTFDVYKKDSKTTTKLAALKDSVNSFLDATAGVNAKITDENQKHHISLAWFSGGRNNGSPDAQISQHLTQCENNNLNTLKNNVATVLNKTDNATVADAGMKVAKEELESGNARKDAKKVVIFFTDGQPTSTGQGFDTQIANNTIEYAKQLKANGALIYSVGVFNDADVNDTTGQFNSYMHAMTNNFPNATAWNNLGERAENSDFYKVAKDAKELANIFSSIFEDITSESATYPTEIAPGVDPSQGGFVTFTDVMGDYMEVDDFKAICFATKQFKDPSKTVDGNKTTYVFEGEGENPLYSNTNVNSIQITVEKSNDKDADGNITEASLKAGDKVTVKIPAALIPIHYYHVELDENGKVSMTVDEALPIHIFYGASLKEGVEEKIANPDATLKQYITANTVDKKVRFYANDYQNATPNVVNSTFEPAKKNQFYYFQKDQYLWLDEAGTIPATGEIDKNATYYYIREYYEEGKDEVQKSATGVRGDSPIMQSQFPQYDGVTKQWYIPEGTPRTSTVLSYAVNKANKDLIGKAEYVIKPQWMDPNPNNRSLIINSLGNNGYLALDIPGELTVTKTVIATAGLTAPTDKEFTFNLELKAPNGKSLKEEGYVAQIFGKDKDGNEVKVGDEFNVAVKGNAESYTFTLKADQTIHIYGLEDGVTYKVTEVQPEGGFTQTTPADNGAAEGTIAGGEESTESFVNEYTTTPVEYTPTDLGLNGLKTLEGRDFQEGDEFTFEIVPSQNTSNAPLPTDEDGNVVSTVTIRPENGNEAEVVFNGKFKFTKPGEYSYTINEVQPKDQIPGITYDTTQYRLIVTIKDNGDGTMGIAKVTLDKRPNRTGDDWENLFDADAVPVVGQPYIQYKNIYDEKTAAVTLIGQKVMDGKALTDYTSKEQFGFELTAGGSRTNGSEDEFVPDVNQPMPTEGKRPNGEYIYANATTGDIRIEEISFDHSHIGKEYKYVITELQPTTNGKVDGEPLEGAIWNDATKKWTYKGITFDNEKKVMTIKVTSKQELINGIETEVIVTSVSSEKFTVTNSYLSQDDLAINGTKTLTGRDFRDGDEFTFTLEAAKGTPMPKDGKVEEVNGKLVETVTIKPTEGTTADVAFGTIHYTSEDLKDAAKAEDGSRTKVFIYTLKETQGTISGITYDTKERVVKVTVTDDGYGKMTVSSDMKMPETLQWKNEYHSEINYGTDAGLIIMKTLNGRSLQKDDFGFNITPVDGAPIQDADKEFRNHEGRPSGMALDMPKLEGVTFTQEDAGKTYTYQVTEIQENKLGGVTYDKSQYTVAIQVFDDGNATMHTITTVTKTHGKDGAAITEPESVKYDSRGEQPARVPFVNEYDPGPTDLNGEANLGVVKNFSGRPEGQWLDTDVFKFTIAPEGEKTVNAVTAGDVVMPTPTEITIGKDTLIDNAHEAYFGNITFKKAGDYQFRVKEDSTDPIPGVTYDKSEKIITVQVRDNGTGNLVATVPGSSDKLNFSNTYKASEPAKLDLTVNKHFTGREWFDSDVFAFELSPYSDHTATQEAVKNGDIILPVNEDGDYAGESVVEIKGTDKEKTAKFGDITFKKPGQYMFEVQELEGDTPGITYDTDKRVVIVNIADNYKGSLEVESVRINTTDGTLTFDNSYTPNPGTVDGSANFGFEKQVSGRDWKDGEAFTFEITAAEGTPMPKNEKGETVTTVTVEKPATGNSAAFNFPNITYTEADMADAEWQNDTRVKTFTYTIKEVKPSTGAPGMTYDTTPRTVAVTVTDDGKGGLQTAVTTQTDKVFKNQYESDLNYTTAGGLVITKVLNGRDMTDGQFTFQVTPKDEASAKVFGLKNGVNEFKSPAAKDGKTAIVQQLAKEGVTFTQDDAGQTYTYTIKEVDEALKGYTYDTPTREVTITVTDDGNGTLTAKTCVTGGPEGTKTYVYQTGQTFDEENAAKVPFINEYEASTGADGGTDAVVTAKKSLKGRPLQEGEFHFRIAPRNKEDITIAEATNQADGTITFPAISYNIDSLKQAVKDGYAVKESNDTWTVNYTVYEIDIKELGQNGVTATTASIEFTVTVQDNGNGSMTATVNMPNGMTFENSYNVNPVEVTLNGGKLLQPEEGTNLTPPDITGKYTFTITGEKGAPMPEKTTVSNDAEGNVNFGKVTFSNDIFDNVEPDTVTKPEEGTAPDETVTQPDKEKEPEASTEASTEESTSEPATEDVAKTEISTEEGAAEPEVSTEESTAEPEVTTEASTAEPEVTTEASTAEPEVTTEASTAEPKVTTEASTAEPKAKAEPKKEEKAKPKKEVKAAPKAEVKAPDVRTKTFKYTVTETGQVNGVTNDREKTKTFTVTITDDGKGHVTAVSNPEEGHKFLFVNTYNVQEIESSITDEIAITKKLEGRDLKDGEFTFELRENGKKVAEGKNDANGKVTFPKITYKKPGEHEYTIHEIAGNANDGVKYDETVYTVHTTVIDNGDGTLGVTHTAEKAVVFHNKYKAKGTSVVLGASKVLVGKDLTEKEFTFQLKNSEGRVISEAKNAADGSVQFDEILYDKPGVYEYTISEVNDQQTGITYDETVYKVTVTVKDDKSGSLVVSTEGEAAIFTNKYTEPGEPGNPDNPDTPDTPDNPGNPDNPDTPDKPNTPDKPDKPNKPNKPNKPDRPDKPNKTNQQNRKDTVKATNAKTGDTAKVGLWLVLALVSGIGILAVFFEKRRNRK